MVKAYYNEIDKRAVAVLRHLIGAGVIAPGDVDDRSIKDVTAGDVKGYTQLHFFAGGGLWSVAARLAGWPDERPLWTGSCPCQPFSVIGERKGEDDPRHLWPDFYRIISAARRSGFGPAVLMGEQVAKAAGYDWFDGVRADLARENIRARTVDIPACGVDAPHERNRLYWVAVQDGEVGNAVGEGLERYAWHGDAARRWPIEDRPAAAADGSEQAYFRNGSWFADWEWVTCHDERSRRAKPGIPMLVDGFSGRVDLWRLAGNAVSPILAAEVIGAFLDAEREVMGAYKNRPTPHHHSLG